MLLLLSSWYNNISSNSNIIINRSNSISIIGRSISNISRVFVYIYNKDIKMGPKGIKPEDQIRKLSKIEANKVCVDCPDKVTIIITIIATMNTNTITIIYD